jgi:diguanylate cyclase (GGDEF)-like protein/PAS domain S-box-containing protein
MFRKKTNGSILNGEKETTLPDSTIFTQKVDEIYSSLFIDSPISLWLEDFSEVKKYIDSLRDKGIKDFRRHFEDNSKDVAHCASLVRIIDVNNATLELYKAKNKEELKNGLNNIFCEESYPVFREELIAIAEGRKVLEAEAITHTLTGQKIDISLRWAVIEGTGKALSRVIVSIVDITHRRLSEKMLRESENLYRALAESAQDIIFLISSDMKIKYVNTFAAKSINRKPEEIIGKYLNEIFPPHIFNRYGASLKKVFDSKKVLYIEDELLSGAEEKWLGTSLVPTGNRLDKTEAVLGISHDITERKKAEKSLREALSRFEAVIEYTPMVAIQGFERDGTIRHWNTACSSLYGFDASEVIGKRIQDILLSPEEKTTFERMVCDIWDSGRATSPQEWQVYTRNREKRWVYSTMFPITENDRVTEVFCMDVNITERKQIEDALRESESKFKGLSEESLTGVYLIQDEAFKYVNPMLAQIFGYSVEELVNKKGPQDLVVSEEWPVVKENLRKRISGEISSIHYFFKGLTKDKKVIDVEVYGSKTEYLGRPAVIGTLLDITERKRSEERITKINSCFLSLGTDPIENINRLTALCGELLGATCALYNRLDGELLYLLGKWNVPPDFKLKDNPDGHICYDVIRLGTEEIFVIRNLAESEYAKSDPNVLRYGLQTYMGKAINLEGIYVGALCVVYQNDIAPTEDDKRLMEIISSAIGIEERRRQAEDNLTEEKSLLRTLIDNLPDYIYVKDDRSRFLVGNNAVAHVMGVETPDELLGKTDFEFYPEELAAKFYADEQKIIQSGIPLINKEEDGLHQVDKKEIRVLTTKVPLKDMHGKIIGIVGLGHDITELKKIESALREGKQFLSSIFESIQDGISILDKEMNILQVNPAMRKWYTHAEPLEGKKCYEAYHSADKPCDICPTRKTIETSSASYEIVPKRAKGGEIVGWLDLYSFPLFDTVTGELKGIIEYVRDITERKQAQERIIKERQRYEGLVNNINVGIYRTTPGMEGIFIEINPAFVSMFDADSREDLIGRKARDVYQNLADRAKLSDKLLKFGYIKNEEFQFKSLKGRAFWGSITAVAIRDDKGNDYFDGIVEDITERKHSEEILNYKIEFEKLISAISTSFINIPIHEIDNNINLALKRIGEFVNVDRSYVFLAYDGAKKADNTHEWCASGVQSEISKLQGLSEKDFPWFAKKIKSSEYLYIPSLEILPQEATAIKELLQASGVKSMICVPMFYSGQPIGFLGFDSIKEKRIWTDENIALLKIVGEIFANAIERKQAQKRLERLNRGLSLSNKKLKQMSLIDSSSGLFNHRYLMEIIESEFYRARRSSHALSAIKADVDYFKSINDTYGHQFGDLVLKQLAGTLKQMVRQYDIVVRFGGEEFVIISPGTDKPTAIILAQRILDAIGLLNFGTKKYAVKLKLSMAVASYPDDRIIKGTDLIELTEKILNKGKEYGGNRVYSSEDIKVSKPAVSKKATAESEVKYLKEKIEKLTRRASQSLIESVFAFARTIELKDHYTGQHTEKTVKYATEVAKELKLPKEDVELIRQASILHDLGKIGISEKILRKKSKLTTKEFHELKKHPQIGADVIRPIQLLHNIIPLMLHHHERWDGKGYPSGLRREEIPLGARIVAIADVFQALTSNRPYRKAYSRAKAIRIIKGNAGNQFDPEVVNAFLRVLKQ